MESNRKNSAVKGEYRSLAVCFVIALFIVSLIASLTENNALLIIYSILIAILVLLNFKYIVVNKLSDNKIKIHNIESISTSLHPLEVLSIDYLWHRKKKRITKNQFLAAVLYEIDNGNLEMTDSGIIISPNIDVESLNFYSLKILEMALLERIDCRKIYRLKIEKIKKLQEEGVAVSKKELDSNVSENIADIDKVYEILEYAKNKYFEDAEGSFSSLLMVISWGSLLMTAILVVKFYGAATVLNFYLPIVLSVLLVSTLTGKKRIGVALKKSEHILISDTLNYISWLEKNINNRADKIYACCIEKSKDADIIDIFNK